MVLGRPPQPLLPLDVSAPLLACPLLDPPLPIPRLLPPPLPPLLPFAILNSLLRGAPSTKALPPRCAMLKPDKAGNSGNVEKLLNHRIGRDRTLAEIFVIPYEPITLARPMTLFPTTLGLTPRVASIPFSDYLADLLCGHKSVQAALRKGLGDVNFRNLRNYALGRKTTEATRERLLALLRDQETLELVAEHFRRPEQSAPTQLLQMGEGAMLLCFTALLGLGATYSHCGKNMITPQESWWSEQPCVLGPPEYRFLDRLLYVPAGLAHAPALMDGNSPSPTNLRTLSAPDRLPFQHWLGLIRKAYSSPDLAHLAVRAGMEPRMTGTLYRVNAGEMLTDAHIDAITQRLGNSQRVERVRKQGRVVRRIAFAVDFLRAAHSGAQELELVPAQKIVHDRLSHLCDDIQRVLFALERTAKK